MTLALHLLGLFVLLIFILLFLLGVGIRHVRRSSLPRTSGTVSVRGLLDEVEIHRDRYGIPHIFADSMEDAAFACGFVHAQDRLWQMEFLRRVGAGRVAEFAGAEAVETDRFVRRLGLSRVVAAEAAALPVEERRMLEAYAAGVNSQIASRKKLPMEFRLVRLTPEPWLPTDSLLVIKLLSLGLSLNWEIEEQRLRFLKAVGVTRAAAIHPLYPEANPTIIASTLGAAEGVQERILAMYQEAARWIPAAGAGSNSWVVDGTRTASGRPLLCNDPHLAPALPSPWYQLHVSAKGDFQATGVSFPGLPFVVIGHNEHVAWGFTNSFADVQDLVIEDFANPSHTQFRTEKGFVRSTVVREVIVVKGASDLVEEVVITRHGPVVARIDDVKRGVWRGLALQWTSLQPGTGAQALLAMQRASNWKSFQAAMVAFDSPSQNAVYADDAGHIGYVLAGRIPVRQGPASGLPTIGWTGQARWQRYLLPEEMPYLLDPKEHVIVTANNRVVGTAFPHYIAHDYMNGYRAKRIFQLLADGECTPERMADIQMDLLSLPALEAIAQLERYSWEGPEEDVRVALVAWDGRMTADAREPLLFESFFRHFVERVLAPVCGEGWGIIAGTDLTHPLFGYPGNTLGRFTPFILSVWAEGGEQFCGQPVSWDAVARAAMRDCLAEFDFEWKKAPRWGRIHAMTLSHPLVVSKPFLRFLFPQLRVDMPGGGDTVLASAFALNQPYATTIWAPSWRQVMDVGAWDMCTGVFYPGQSGEPTSRHYRDLLRYWRRNEQLPLAWSREVVETGSRRRLRLVPLGESGSQPAPERNPGDAGGVASAHQEGE